MLTSSFRVRAIGAVTAIGALTGGLVMAGVASAAPGCKVDYAVQTKWQGGFTANVTITNLGDPVDGWRLAWAFPGSERYGQGWNAVFSASGASVTASNVDYNRQIPTGGTASFGFNGTMTGDVVGVPSTFTLNGTTCTGALNPTTTTTTTTTTDPGPGQGDPTGRKQVERLDRGVVSVRSGSGNLVSWRLLAGDSPSTGFTVYRGGTKLNATPITGSTNYLDSGGAADASYTVRAVVDGVEQPASSASLAFGSGYRDVPIQSPGAGYGANDASVGDLDGDGDYEFVLKWDPDNAKDNSQAGVTGNVFVDAYRLDGSRLWRIDLGRNIRAGAHYTQFQVYDYDGDGRAEVAMKTADGTRDGRGAVIGNASADYRNSSGYILTGPEFLTMFDGRTGAAMSTVNYDPPRGNVGSWGDTYGNRVDRFLAGTAYLDGARPSLIMARGYYTRAVVAAWDFRDGTLTKRWTFDSNTSGNSGYAGQGNHSLTIGDVDADGRDEIVYGAATIDDNGRGLWTTGLGHGDAAHLGDLDPSRPGLEYFKVSEDSSKPGSWFADARTGARLWTTASGSDNGRGVSGDIYAGSPGAESWSSADGGLRSPSGANVGRKPSSANFLIWWDGDPTRELLDQTRIDKYGTGGDTRLLTGSGVASNNGTKATPALSADLVGDWREEVVWRTSDNSALRIYSTPHPTDRRIPTLMHDTMYRVAIAWQNTAYNQPPHPSFPIGNGMATPPWPDVHYAG
ncbi:cellulose binding domain-containing protein [Saccharothrix saharensis]|uniref:Cellulose binding domain-containing protein n=1 Tax=Saccharothrix saharensis TaxID=571190 RepID=A0A543J5U8_9PSEU|nr:cellulose binding domain-containing protein [Saccharothrix saharensis]TQM78225.1 cellulose binding domain-containing protein [Saccharothrix saharensis]